MKMLYAFLIVAAMTLLMMALAGCNPDPAVVAAQKQSQVDLAKAKAKSDLAAANAKANPVAHPFTSTNATVTALQKPLATIAVISFVLLAVSIGLAFTALSVISKIAVPVTGSVAVMSFAGVIALPFFPYVLASVGVLVVGLFIYELIRYHSLKGVLTEAESYLHPSTGAVSLLPPLSTVVPAAVHLVHA